MCCFKFRLWNCLSYPQDSETAGGNTNVYFRQPKSVAKSCKADIPCTARNGSVFRYDGIIRDNIKTADVRDHVCRFCFYNVAL